MTKFTFLRELSLYIVTFSKTSTSHHWMHIEVVEKSFSAFLYILWDAGLM